MRPLFHVRVTVKVDELPEERGSRTLMTDRELKLELRLLRAAMVKGPRTKPGGLPTRGLVEVAGHLVAPIPISGLHDEAGHSFHGRFSR